MVPPQQRGLHLPPRAEQGKVLLAFAAPAFGVRSEFRGEALCCHLHTEWASASAVVPRAPTSETPPAMGSQADQGCDQPQHSHNVPECPRMSPVPAKGHGSDAAQNSLLGACTQKLLRERYSFHTFFPLLAASQKTLHTSTEVQK